MHVFDKLLATHDIHSYYSAVETVVPRKFPGMG